MAPSIPLVAALLTASHAAAWDESSMLQMPVVEQNLETDQDECRCPGYYQPECEAEAAQGCVWSDAGSSNGPWCQCLNPDTRPPVDPATVTYAPLNPVLPPAPAPVLPPAPAPPPTHYFVVNSWPEHAWGAWDSESRNSEIEKCLPKEQTTDTDGSGYLFTSCCTSEGAGMSRDCGSTRNTDFDTAVAQCASQGGRLCTADEAMSQATVSKGCSVDGPSGALGADLNRLWTSTPCTALVEQEPVVDPVSNELYSLVHQGHCASGWISGSNTLQADIAACHAQCSENSECGYFAFAEGVSAGTNCALYTPCGGCDDDTNFEHYNAYQMTDRSCPLYSLVHQGHCASGWISGSNTFQADITACHDHCSENPECGYFAFAEDNSAGTDWEIQAQAGTNCGLYIRCGGCDDDSLFEHYTAYQMTERSC